MGTLTRTRITAKVGTRVEGSILEAMGLFRATECWNQYGQPDKWYPDDMMIELGKKFPQVMFRVDVYGDRVSITRYYFNNKEISKSNLPIYFPSEDAFELGYEHKTDKAKKTEEVAAEAEVASKKAQIVALEAKLVELKA